MDHRGMNLLPAVFVKVYVVMTPVVRKIGAHQDNIAGIKSLDMIAYELCAAALVKIDQLYFRVIMPAIVDIRIPVITDTE